MQVGQDVNVGIKRTGHRSTEGICLYINSWRDLLEGPLGHSEVTRNTGQRPYIRVTYVLGPKAKRQAPCPLLGWRLPHVPRRAILDLGGLIDQG